MQLVLRRRPKKSRAARAASAVARTAVKVKLARRAPRAAAVLWAARRSGVLRPLALAAVGVITLRALRRRSSASGKNPGSSGSSEAPRAPEAAPPAAGPTPDPGAPAAAPAPGDSATPPHGDKLAAG